jgi:hypothetical protein
MLLKGQKSLNLVVPPTGGDDQSIIKATPKQKTQHAKQKEQHQKEEGRTKTNAVVSIICS